MDMEKREERRVEAEVRVRVFGMVNSALCNQPTDNKNIKSRISHNNG